MPKFILSTWSITKIILDFIKKYSDIFILLPFAFLVFIHSYTITRWLDPTAIVLDAGNVSILIFNFLTAIVTFVTSSFIYITYFGDGFKKNWENSIKNPIIAKLISGGLWLSTLIITYFILTRNL